MTSKAEIEVAAQALWVDASKDRFGKWPTVTGEFKDAWRKSAKAALEAAERSRWQPIETAPRDGTIIDVWLGDSDASDVKFYCTPGTCRSCGWFWKDGKFRPSMGLSTITTFIVPTHWQHLPPPPESK